MQHGLSLRRGGGQQQRLGSAHAGEVKTNFRAPQPRRGVQNKLSGRCGQLPHAHLRQPLQMQVDGSCPDTAAPGQHGAYPPKPRQQRRTEQDGCPHPACGLRCKVGAHGLPLHHQFCALPARCAAHAPQQGKTVLHIGQARHILQPHRPAAQQRSCQQRQHTVFGRRHFHPALQRPPACNDPIPSHAKTPVLQKIPHGMQNEGLWSTKRTETAFPPSAGFVRSFVRFFPHFRAGFVPLRQEISPFISFRPGTPKARCPSRPEASSGWCRRRRKRAG